MEINIVPDKEKANQELVNYRLLICDICTLKEDLVCSSCGCLLERKTFYVESACPLGKW